MNSKGKPIEWEKAMSDFENDREFMIHLLKSFIQRFLEWQKEMEILIKESRTSELRRLIHKIKGAAGNLYAPELYEKAAEWEEDLLNQEWNSTSHFFAETSNEVDKIREFLENIT